MDLRSSTEMFPIPETVSVPNISQLLATAAVEDLSFDQATRSSSSIRLSESIPIMVTSKQKSLASVYDIPLDIPSIVASLPSVAIIGGNERARAFEKRLLAAGFTQPLRCDVNSKDNVDSVSFETVQQSSPTIILITEDVPTYVRNILDQSKQPLIVDAREITAQISPIILGFYRAFGNLSDREIGQGTERVAVAVELSSPLDLIQFIDDLNCFSRGINRLDHYSYTHLHRRSFPNCLFPFLLTTMTLSLHFVLSMCEHRDQKQNNVQLISRQASSITASTSITLLAIAFLARPMVELIELLQIIVSERNSTRDGLLRRSNALDRWLQARSYLLWYSLSCACLHLLFLSFSRLDSGGSTLFIVAFFFGMISWICLTIFSSVHLPWISERLVWKEYHLLSSYSGSACLLVSFGHVCLHWSLSGDVLNLKFLSMLLPLVVLILRLLLYGMVHPSVKFLHWLQRRSVKRETNVSAAH